jgi:hypothetical protein
LPYETPRISGRFFSPRTSHGLAFGLALVHLGVSRGDLGVHPRCSDSPPRFVGKGRFAAHVSIGLRPLHLCGTRLEGGHQGLSRRYGQLEGEPLGWVWPPKPAVTVGVLVRTFRLSERVPRCYGASRGRSRPARLVDCSATVTATASSRSGVASSARPTRTSGFGRVFGAHPRGEFRTSGAAVGQIRAWAAIAAFPLRNAEDCLSSEGGHRRVCAPPPKPAAA